MNKCEHIKSDKYVILSRFNLRNKYEFLNGILIVISRGNAVTPVLLKTYSLN